MKKFGIVLVCVVLSLALCFGAAAEEIGSHIGELSSFRFSEKTLIDPHGETFAYYDDLTSLLLALDRGDIDRCGLTLSVCNYIIAQNPGKYEITETVTDNIVDGYLMLALEAESDFMAQLNTAIAELQKDGTLAQLEETYLSPKTPDYALELPVFEGAPTYRVVLTGDLPPMDYVSTEGNADGYNLALLSALSEKLQVNFEIVTANAASRLIMLTSDKADLVFWTVYPSCQEYPDIPDGCIGSDAYLTEQLCDLTLAQ